MRINIYIQNIMYRQYLRERFDSTKKKKNMKKYLDNNVLHNLLNMAVF